MIYVLEDLLETKKVRSNKFVLNMCYVIYWGNKNRSNTRNQQYNAPTLSLGIIFKSPPNFKNT